ncbi:GNAT family N-acetyltransferase [Roseateles sp. BYS180W]|uniref:GNAT family N-acetyltransferase n=1 Tax=Roseateles rivi TaxID=3299028 RepID=A0ABW7FV94_9BURK
MSPISALQVEPVTLRGRWVCLEPMSLAHVDELCACGLDPALWRWTPSSVSTPAQMQAYVERALADQASGKALPFVLRDVLGGQLVGSTRFGNIAAKDRCLEIGWTWVATSHQRSGVNTEAKTLLLTHAFETLGAHRVELKTDALNETSRRAIARLGAVQEGIFRRHVVIESGRVRDTVYFSITDEDWPSVKLRLQALAR